MGVRAMWKGVVELGEGVPVKLYSAVEDRTVRFRLLHETDGVPVKREMVDPETGDPVPYSEARRGWETEDGRMVVLDEEDLEELEPEASRSIEVLRFVEPSDLPHPWYDRPYYLGPDGDADAWAALARALERTGLEGVVRWTMRKKRYRGALRLHDGVPMLVTLRDARAIVEAPELDTGGDRELEEEELGMARRLVEMMEGSFEPERWEDEHRARVRELIEAKAEGKTISIREYERKREEGASLAAALQASLEDAEGRKSA